MIIIEATIFSFKMFFWATNQGTKMFFFFIFVKISIHQYKEIYIVVILNWSTEGKTTSVAENAKQGYHITRTKVE